MVNARPHKLKSGKIVWRVQHRIDGKVVTDTFDDERGATQFAALVDRVDGAAARDVLRRRREGRNVITLRDWTVKYLDPESGLLTGIDPATRDDYRRIAERSFLVTLGEYPVDSITKQDIGQWVAWQEAQPATRVTAGGVRVASSKPLSAKTIRNYHALLSSVLKGAQTHGVATENPAYRTRLSRGMQEEAVFLSRAQFARLYEATPEHYRPLVAFLVGSQARWSEATALQWKHVHGDTTPPTVSLHQAWKKKHGHEKTRIGVTKTRRGRRTIALWPELVQQFGAPGAPDDYVFTGPLGGRQWYSPFRKVWDKAVVRAGLDPVPTPHDLRHTGASWLIADGKPLPFIQQRLGHESITTTINTYGHLLPDVQTQMSDSMAAIMSNVLPRIEA
ncbi:tyrosine-type recombinase/integrase [Agromyces aureus]|uniref:Integrase n=1 Tax=Agromyces aureus TaxID=453304 RepID=A0A191WEX7_9MICO|nr:site-specific integrase [Agromyces aureus]ANJ26835.1 hypothetical protein ATC03_08985 [Agromyces aureus]